MCTGKPTSDEVGPPSTDQLGRVNVPLGPTERVYFRKKVHNTEQTPTYSALNPPTPTTTDSVHRLCTTEQTPITVRWRTPVPGALYRPEHSVHCWMLYVIDPFGKTSRAASLQIGRLSAKPSGHRQACTTPYSFRTTDRCTALYTLAVQGARGRVSLRGMLGLSVN